MVKLFGFICSLIQPTRANSEPIRLLGLSLVNIILETQPPEALFPGLLPTIQDELCRHLMLARTPPPLLQGLTPNNWPSVGADSSHSRRT